MGRPRKKPIEPEIVSDDELIEAPRVAKRTHKIETVYDETVPIDESGEVITDDIEDDEPEVAERKAYVKSERTRIREKLKKAGVSSNQPLRLRVDRLPNYKIDGASGLAAERAFCFAMECNEDFVANGEALVTEIQKRCGPGEYWITVRYKNSILDQWKELIAPPIAPQPIPMADPNNPNGPPQYVYWPQQNGTTQAEVIKPLSRREMLKEMVEEIELTERLRGKREETTAPPPVPAFDVQAFAAQVMQSKQVMDVLISGLGGGGGKRRDTLEVVLEHLPGIIREAKDMGRELIQEFRQGASHEQNQNQEGEPRAIAGSHSDADEAAPRARQSQAGAPTRQRSPQGTQGASKADDLFGLIVLGYMQQAEASNVAGSAIMFASRYPTDEVVNTMVDLKTRTAEQIFYHLKTTYAAVIPKETLEILDKKQTLEWFREVQRELNEQEPIEEDEEGE